MRTIEQDITNPDFLNVVTLGELNTHSNPLAEISTAQTGITTAGLRAFSALMHWEMSVVATALGTTERTLLRNKGKHLNKQISENALEVARLSSFGTNYFGDIDSWNTWLDTPNVQFNNKEPRSVMNSIRGRELIRRVINGLQYGFTA
jgi:putative toxin-antitoxin system antitoxin component (TIGR02293 family)